MCVFGQRLLKVGGRRGTGGRRTGWRENGLWAGQPGGGKGLLWAALDHSDLCRLFRRAGLGLTPGGGEIISLLGAELQLLTDLCEDTDLPAQTGIALEGASSVLCQPH